MRAGGYSPTRLSLGSWLPLRGLALAPPAAFANSIATTPFVCSQVTVAYKVAHEGKRPCAPSGPCYYYSIDRIVYLLSCPRPPRHRAPRSLCTPLRLSCRAAPRRIVPPSAQQEQPLLCELMQLTWVAKPEERLDFATVLKRIEHSAVAKAMPKPGKPGPGPVQPWACHSALLRGRGGVA